MSCCLPPTALPQTQTQPDFPAASSRDELKLASRLLENGERLSELSVPSVHCAGCIRTIEEGLKALEGVVDARVNLTGKRVAVRWEGEAAQPLIETLKDLGDDPDLCEARDEKKEHMHSQ